MAYVEAGYPSANLRAQELADKLTAEFTCAKDKARVLSLVDTDLTQLPELLCKYPK